MCELRDRARFAVESGAKFCVPRQYFGQNLQSDGAIEPRIARAIDLAHATRPEWSNDLVRAQADAGRERHWDGAGRL